MVGLPSPISVALLSGVFAMGALIITLAQRLGDWRSKNIARALGVVATLILLCWVYLVLLWVFNIDLRASFSWNSPTLWVVVGSLGFTGLVLAAVRWNWLRIEQRVTEAVITGPNRIDIEITNHPEKTDSPGLLIRANNRRDSDAVASVLAREAKSLNRATHAYRDNSSSLLRIGRVVADVRIKAGSCSNNHWLVRIADGHMEVGNSRGEGTLDWPPLDKSATQRWRIYLTVRVVGFPDWNREFDIEWQPRSDTIWIIR